MFCKQCGRVIDDNQELCEECKSNMENNKSAQTEQSSSNSQNTQTINVNLNTNSNTSSNATPKSKIAAGILGIFLGCFGVHNFYLGYTGKAVAQLLITVFTCGFFAFISGIWGLIEGILILTGSINTDGNGFPLVD